MKLVITKNSINGIKITPDAQELINTCNSYKNRPKALEMRNSAILKPITNLKITSLKKEVKTMRFKTWQVSLISDNDLPTRVRPFSCVSCGSLNVSKHLQNGDLCNREPHCS